MRDDFLGSQTRPSAAPKAAGCRLQATGCCRCLCPLTAFTRRSPSLFLPFSRSLTLSAFASALAGFISGAILCIFMVGCRCRLARKTETENCYLLCYQLCVAPSTPRCLPTLLALSPYPLPSFSSGGVYSGSVWFGSCDNVRFC